MRMSFDEFCGEIENLAKKYGRDMPVKVEQNPRREIAKVYGPHITPVEMAKDGLDGISELASDVAEHHPHWGIISGCSSILDTLLERWDDSLTGEDLSQIRWDLERISRALESQK
ncbi:MAG: hypothetical protein D9C04_04945 [Nitrosopumilus sp. B06]|nr:MAG: hypothetical protein D9C04_04945 [Nitrosopumilus sp. B06]